jgi:hypothetical protein
METDVRMFLEPALAFFIGDVEDDVKLAIREGGSDAVHEAEKFDAPPPLRAVASC